jgi:hypothetical protein
MVGHATWFVTMRWEGVEVAYEEWLLILENEGLETGTST